MWQNFNFKNPTNDAAEFHNFYIKNRLDRRI